jgi:hypothetical protein
MRDTIAVTTRIAAQLELVAVTTVLSRRARSFINFRLGDTPRHTAYYDTSILAERIRFSSMKTTTVTARPHSKAARRRFVRAAIGPACGAGLLARSRGAKVFTTWRRNLPTHPPA